MSSGIALNVSTYLTGDAEQFPDRLAIACGDVHATYAEEERRVNSLALALTFLGLQKGDRVAHPPVEWPTLSGDDARAQGVTAPGSVRSTSSDGASGRATWSRAEEISAFASELYDNVNTRLARDPTRLRCHWKLSQLLVTKRARAL